MHTVFINDRPLRFINVYDKHELESAKGSELYSENDKPIEELISLLENGKEQAEIFYLSENPDSAWNILISNCTLVEAAGGLVQHHAEEYLLIYRNHLWDLPKGKIEFDESPEEAAVREVKEECGVRDLTIVQKLPLTFHVYHQNNKRMLKKNNWFLMESSNRDELIPQKDEGIEEARWMNKNSIQTIALKNIHASIAELLKHFFGWR